MDLFEYDESNGWDDLSLDNELEWDDNIIHHKRKTKGKIDTPLVNDDYNLNSPIMPDIIDGLYNYFSNGILPSHHSSHIGKIIKSFLGHSIKFRESGSIHKTYHHAYNIIKTIESNPSNKTKKFVKDWSNNFLDIKGVIDLFVESIGSQKYNNFILENITLDDDLINLLDKYLEINFIIELMVQGRARVKYTNYDRNWKVKLLETPSKELIQINTTRFKGILNQEVLILSEEYVIYDKNILLMMKDVIIGRFNTLVITKFNTEGRYSKDLPDILKRIFILGDQHVVDLGNSAFEDFTLLEPLCINRFDYLANKTRPNIKRYYNFEKYLIDKITDEDSRKQKFKHVLKMEIDNIDNPHDLTALFGSFRLFGHPVIEYEVGLLKVKEQVRMKKNIEPGYPKKLASDLMRIALTKHYNKNNTWNIINNDHNREIIGSDKLFDKFRPNKTDLSIIGDRWDELEIEPIFEIPEDIEDSNIFSDKTHSLDLDDIIKFKKRDSTNPIPTRRVLKTYLEKEKINARKFVQNVDKEGLPKKALVIGLKAKERELKRFGRFFTLMTWDLRLYFVISEYLIKKDLVKMFDGLTMADSFVEVMNKMLSRTRGQAHNTYENITFANHIDYSKWNNHQRDEAVGPVFSVMDKLYGLKNFFRRSHQFFKDSIIYYPERPEYFGQDSGDNPFYWEGQPGGFEGIRQKGWSVVGILCLLRETRDRNTTTEFLVQGDNQVIFNHYNLQKHLNPTELQEELDRIIGNNSYIIDKIKTSSSNLGLLINDDETLQSANFSSYSKVPIYKGNILNLETKKYNRVNGLTNDQLPTSSNIMSSVNSTALSVCQYDPVCRNSAYWHGVFGIFVMMLLGLWNPMGEFATDTLRFEVKHILRWLYLDQCLGGSTGMSLSRLLIRRFPDPITESLSFYRYMAKHSQVSEVRKLFISFGFPRKNRVTDFSFNKLFEDPTALNIVKGGNILLIIKDQVKKSLIKMRTDIKNEVLRKALDQSVEQERYLLNFLKTIKPCFPRFISDFKSSSICGYIDQIVGLVQNSRTIRNLFSGEFEKSIKLKVRRWELLMWNSVFERNINNHQLWECSSSHADYLRQWTWEREIVGSTIPHPYEYHSKIIFDVEKHIEIDSKDLITCVVPRKYSRDINCLGHSKPYLGSNTKESTSVLQPWEKEITNPMYRKASALRRGINWLTNRDSLLSKSIYNNLRYITNVDLSDELESLKKRRSGTAEHRYRSDRQSNGGFCNISPNILTWIIVTSNHMDDLSDTNYDFMFQASMIYAETIGASLLYDMNVLYSFGMGISCSKCIREIKNIQLESQFVYNPESILKQFWLSNFIFTEVKEADEKLDDLYTFTDDDYIRNIPYSVGFHQALGYFLSVEKYQDNRNISDLFPLGVSMKISPGEWITGLIDGLVISASYSVLNNADFVKGRFPISIVGNRVHTLVTKLCDEPAFVPILNLNNVSVWITTSSRLSPPEYPPSNKSIIRCFKTLFMFLYSLDKNNRFERLKFLYKSLKVFNDFDNDYFKIVLQIGFLTFVNLQSELPNTSRVRNINNVRKHIEDLREESNNKELFRERFDRHFNYTVKIYILHKELRYVVENDYVKISDNLETQVYHDSDEKGANWVDYDQLTDLTINVKKEDGKELPFISGLRVYRASTGAHYKMNLLLNELHLSPEFCIVGGDGSGGMSALILRKYINCKVIYNSLLEVNETNYRGSNPGTPQAIASLPQIYKDRCLNFEKNWLNPNDLTSIDCWKYLVSKNIRGNSLIDLIILDMEARETDKYRAIYENLLTNISNLDPNGVAIVKSYTNIMADINDILLLFRNRGYSIFITNSKYSSSYTTEVYLVITKRSVNLKSYKNYKPNITRLDFFNNSIADDIHEFKRGLEIDVRKMYTRIPPPLRECYSVYYLEYLNELKVQIGIGESTIGLFLHGKYKEYIDKCLYYMIINVNLGLRELLSDHQLIKLICWYIALLLFIAYKTKNFTLYNDALFLNNNKLEIHMNRMSRLFCINQKMNIDSYHKNLQPIRDNTYINLMLRVMIGMDLSMDKDHNKAGHWTTKMNSNLTEGLW
ncbi:L protein [Almendravirus arboretum]|uniref:Replicase n=1 Tax=Almendravirus arboretum TaxID=1972683 RepID=X4QGQ1_9RHAB|nr:L protein [Almendravirus arboretum]AHU86500.1 L protein [Almendravirus arboretum]